MEPVRLGVGTEWLLDGRTFRVVRQISNDLFVAEDIKFRIPRQFTRSDILTSYADGTLSFSAVDPIVNEAQGNVGSPVVHDLTEQQQAVLRDRWPPSHRWRIQIDNRRRMSFEKERHS